MDLWVPVIDRFRGEYFFLSNFYPAVTPYRGRHFRTSEHAFAAAKTCDPDTIEEICAAEDPAEAKRIGQSAPLAADWGERRFAVMEEIITAKTLDLLAKEATVTVSSTPEPAAAGSEGENK